MHSAGAKSDSLLCRISETVSKPKTLSILGNILTTSKLTKTESLMIIFLLLMLSVMQSISGMSFILQSILLTYLYK